MADNSLPIQREDSNDSQDPANAAKSKKVKSRRPANTAFRQQRLKAWQPILTPKTVLPLFFTIGIIFGPIGGALLYASALVKEIEINYTDCASKAPENLSAMPDGLVKWSFKSDLVNQARWSAQQINYTYKPDGFKKAVTYETTQCTLEFTTPDYMGTPIFFYYRLTNFYQNHRRYVKSFQSDQLKGVAVDNGTISSGPCDPIKTEPISGKPYFPCGLIANSVFNDTFSNLELMNPSPKDFPDAGNKSVTIQFYNNSGISWDSDKDLYGKTNYANDAILPPPNWQVRYPNNYTDDNPAPDLSKDEAFQVWMRTAGLPTFSKLAQRNDNTTMPPGTYQILVSYNFPVLEYGGTKTIIISTRTVMGGKNPFLGIAYVVVGGLCVLLGAIFTVAHLIKPRKLGDHSYLSWNTEQPSTATTTGRDMRPEGA